MNCQSIKNKIAELQTFISSTEPDIVLGTESWLQPEVLSCEIFPEEYAVYRKDRKTVKKTKGGGVFILVRKEFITSEIKIDTHSEIIFIDLKLKGQQNVKIGCLYRPPDSDEDYMKELGVVLGQVDPQHKNNIWIGGDFNLAGIDWNNLTTLPSSPNTKICSALIETINDFSLSQVVDLPTRKANILDLFFTSNPSLVNQVTTTPPLTEKADHDIVFIDVNTQAFIPK